MIAFALVSLLCGLIYLVISVLLFLKNTNIVMSYHVSNIPEDKKEKFCNVMGITFLIPALAFFTTGILQFFIETSTMSLVTMFTLFGGIFINAIAAFIIIKIFNKKIFSE